MIIRVYRCTVVKGMEAEFREFAFKTRHPWLRERPGLVAFYAGRPLPGSDDARAAWSRSGKAPRQSRQPSGDDWRHTPTLPEEARAFVESASVEHYELADEFRSENHSSR